MSARFYPLKVAEIVPETAEANSIRFEIPPELRDEFTFKAGQHLTLKAEIAGVLASARLEVPAYQRPILGGRRGHHSEHLGHLLAVMQFLPRTYPDAVW